MRERHEQPAALERSTATSEEGVLSQRRPHSWVAVAGRRLSKQVCSEHQEWLAVDERAVAEAITCRGNLRA
jgi:hypothetical protein